MIRFAKIVFDMASLPVIWFTCIIQVWKQGKRNRRIFPEEKKRNKNSQEKIDAEKKTEKNSAEKKAERKFTENILQENFSEENHHGEITKISWRGKLSGSNPEENLQNVPEHRTNKRFKIKIPLRENKKETRNDF
jgi:DNA segregation ATPase FtsK/SpoIIIE-like protein